MGRGGLRSSELLGAFLCLEVRCEVFGRGVGGLPHLRSSSRGKAASFIGAACGTSSPGLDGHWAAFQGPKKGPRAWQSASRYSLDYRGAGLGFSRPGRLGELGLSQFLNAPCLREVAETRGAEGIPPKSSASLAGKGRFCSSLFSFSGPFPFEFAGPSNARFSAAARQVTLDPSLSRRQTPRARPLSPDRSFTRK